MSTDCSVEQICKQFEICHATYHKWRRQYGGRMAGEMTRLKELERENARLVPIVALRYE